MAARDWITLTRDTDAIQIPDGTPLVLSAATNVLITQSLGDSYTVTTDRGNMVRISGKDADALGLEVPESMSKLAAAKPTTVAEVEEICWELMRTTYDPEIPVDIVELGLVYSCVVAELDNGGYKAEVVMTLTAPGCGMGDVLRADVAQKIIAIPGVEQAEVEVVFDPPWSMDMMTEAARLQLNM